MAVYTKVYKKDLNDFLKKYNIGNLIKVINITDGIENSNYTLFTSKGKYILTIYEDRVLKEDLPFYLNLLNFLNNKGINCPKPIKKRSVVYLFKSCLRHKKGSFH